MITQNTSSSNNSNFNTDYLKWQVVYGLSVICHIIHNGKGIKNFVIMIEKLLYLLISNI